MMEQGFFHPSRGYWQTTGEPSADILAAYPDGTQPVPLKPGPDHEWSGGEWVHVPPAPVLPTEAQALRQIDHDADAIVRDVIGDRGEEYRQAEADALAFQAAGFAGPAPGSVAVWAAASGMTEQAAAQDVLAQAAAWRTALLAIRQARLTAKAGVRAGTVADAMAAWAAFVAGIRLQLGV